jgi:hypothetical protein
MAKKSRRARKRQKGRKVRPNIPAPPSAGIAAVRPAAAVKPPSEKTIARTEMDFSEQYAYVRQDLKRIGLLAGMMFGAMIVLSFVLR